MYSDIGIARNSSRSSAIGGIIRDLCAETLDFLSYAAFLLLLLLLFPPDQPDSFEEEVSENEIVVTICVL